MNFSKVLIFGVLVSVSSFALSASRSNYDGCHSCHGDQMQGDIERSAPGLAGQSPVYLKRQLANFANKYRGENKNDTSGYRMQQMSIFFSTTKLINDTVDYIGTFKPQYPTDSVNGYPENGRHAFVYACSACHGALGQGVELFNTPGLRTIGNQYFFDQIKKFQNMQRGANPNDELGRIMQEVSHILTDDQMIWDVIAYMQSLPVFDQNYQQVITTE